MPAFGSPVSTILLADAKASFINGYQLMASLLPLQKQLGHVVEAPLLTVFPISVYWQWRDILLAEIQDMSKVMAYRIKGGLLLLWKSL